MANYAKKYNFDLLQVGESQFFPGVPSNIQSSASMWGTRYGIWLSVKREEKGAVVTRLESPPNFKPLRKHEVKFLHEQIKELKDGVRALTVLVIQMKADLAERLS